MNQLKLYENVTRKGSEFKLPEDHELYADGFIHIADKDDNELGKAIVTNIDSEDSRIVTAVAYCKDGFDEFPKKGLRIIMISTKESYIIPEFIPEEEKKIDEIHQRKGRLRLTIPSLKNESESFFKTVFSNFYPIGTDPDHRIGYWDCVEFYGLSPHFDIVEEGTLIPEYEMVLELTKDKEVKFVEFKKRD